jgi:hypothetical protein
MRGPRRRGGASSTGVFFAGAATVGRRHDSATHDGAAAGAVFPVYADAPGQAAMEIGLERSIAARKDVVGCHVWGLFAAGVEDGGGAWRRVGTDWDP